jgi:hypothetical protein
MQLAAESLLEATMNCNFLLQGQSLGGETATTWSINKKPEILSMWPFFLFYAYVSRLGSNL